MKNKIILGLGFGDEGKGLVTDYLCNKSKSPLVIRFSGGHQVGHTVVKNNIRHMFSNFGSGSLSGVPTYWSKYCTVNPIGILNELLDLCKKGILPLLYIDERCPITTQYDIDYNIRQDDENNHGSVGVGFGATINREEKFYSLTFGDLFYSKIFREKLRNIKKFYGKGNHLDDKDFLFIDKCEGLIKFNNIIKKCLYIPEDKDYTTYIFEGSQGLMLDQHFGFFPNVTRSDLGLKNIRDSIYDKLEIYLVTRAYQTRHGNGYMTNQDYNFNIINNKNETNVTNESQGIFRKSLLDVSLLEYVINKDIYLRFEKNKNLVITCLDQMLDYRFTYEDEIFNCKDENDFIKKISKILKIKKVYISKSDESKNIIRWK